MPSLVMGGGYASGTGFNQQQQQQLENLFNNGTMTPGANAPANANSNGFTPTNGPSAVFSGQMPAVDFKPNPYLLNQIGQFRQMQTPNMGTMNAFNARMQGMGGQAQSLLNPVQDSSLGAGLLGGQLRLGTELPGYTPDNKVGYSDLYGNQSYNPSGATGTPTGAPGTPADAPNGTTVGGNQYFGGDYAATPASTTGALGLGKDGYAFNYLNPTGQSTINFNNSMNGKDWIINQNGYNMAQGDDGNYYANIGGLPVQIDQKTGLPNVAKNEYMRFDSPIGMLTADITKADLNGMTLKANNGFTYTQTKDGKTTIPLGKAGAVNVVPKAKDLPGTIDFATTKNPITGLAYQGMNGNFPVYGSKGKMYQSTGDITLPLSNAGALGAVNGINIDMNGTKAVGNVVPQKDGSIRITIPPAAKGKPSTYLMYDPKTDKYTGYDAKFKTPTGLLY